MQYLKIVSILNDKKRTELIKCLRHFESYKRKTDMTTSFRICPLGLVVLFGMVISAFCSNTRPGQVKKSIKNVLLRPITIDFLPEWCIFVTFDHCDR